MFKKATALAKARNKEIFVEDIDEDTAIELLKQAFPKNKNLDKAIPLTRRILRMQQA